MKKLFVGNLPLDATEDSVREMFSAFGTVRSINVASDIFTGRCKGFGFIEMEGHEARAAQAALDELYGLGYDFRSKMEAYYRKVTPGEVLRVGKKYLGRGYVVAITSPNVDDKKAAEVNTQE